MWKNRKISKDLVDERTEVLEQIESQEPYEVRQTDLGNNIGLSEDKEICHGLGCLNYATHSIREDGYDGILILCNNCIKKFPRKVTHKTQKLSIGLETDTLEKESTRHDKIESIYSCKSCASMFADPLCSCKHSTKSNKKKLEQQVVGPDCSNASYMQPGQQSGGSLGD